MVNTNPRTLTETQIADYHDCGYLILRGVLSSGEADALRRLVVEETPRLGYPPKLKYPEPGKYTIGGNSMAEPGFAPIAEHPTVVNAVECLLGHSAYLTAYVAYLRSPGDKGSGAHCDYKRWRPVGSSMNWLFAIIPLTSSVFGLGSRPCRMGCQPTCSSASTSPYSYSKQVGRITHPTVGCRAVAPSGHRAHGCTSHGEQSRFGAFRAQTLQSPPQTEIMPARGGIRFGKGIGIIHRNKNRSLRDSCADRRRGYGRGIPGAGYEARSGRGHQGLARAA